MSNPEAGGVGRGSGARLDSTLPVPVAVVVQFVSLSPPPSMAGRTTRAATIQSAPPRAPPQAPKA